jgi:hypothetical protein
MRIVFAALSFATGMLLLFLLAKVLIAGLLFALTLGAFAFFVRKLKYARYPHLRYAESYAGGGFEPYRYPAHQYHSGIQDDGIFRFRTIHII